MRKLRCFYHDIRGAFAELLNIRRERLRPSKSCPPDCCGHGHIYCMDYEAAPAQREAQYNPQAEV